MSNYELLMYLRKHLDYFEGVSEKDFNLLFILDSNNFSYGGNYLYRVTPLLKQIAEYAMIPVILSDSEMTQIDSLLENQEETLLTSVLEFTGYCHNYISRLIDYNCDHPCVRNLEYMERISSLYEEMMNTTAEIVDNVPNPLLKEEILDLYSAVDNNVYDNIDGNFDKIINKLDEYKIKTVKELLAELKNFTISTFYSQSLLSGVKGYSFFENNNIFLFNSCQVDNLSKIISIASATTNLSIDEELESLLNELLYSYQLYSSYRYYYLQSDVHEKEYLLRNSQM